MPQKCPRSLWWGVCVVGKPNLVKCFGPRLRLWTWTLDFVLGPSFSILSVLCYTVQELRACNTVNIKKLQVDPGYRVLTLAENSSNKI